MIVAILAILCLASVSNAENPDSRPSISFGLNGASGDAETEISGVNVQNADLGQFSFASTLKWPMNENATIAFALGYSKSNTEWNESVYYLASKTKSSGISFGFGLTFYFGESVNK